MRRWAALCAFVVVALFVVASVHADYSADMEPGRLAVRHATWGAADLCRPAWRRRTEASVVMHITLDRRGRSLSAATEPDVPRFARCVLRSLRAQRFSVTGRDAEGAEWHVTSRYVFDRAAQ